MGPRWGIEWLILVKSCCPCARKIQAGELIKFKTMSKSKSLIDKYRLPILIGALLLIAALGILMSSSLSNSSDTPKTGSKQNLESPISEEIQAQIESDQADEVRTKPAPQSEATNQGVFLSKVSLSTLPTCDAVLQYYQSNALRQVTPTGLHGWNRGFSRNMTDGPTDSLDVMRDSAVESSDSTTGSNSAIDHSTTNIQVEGVDEADIVKTDGSYIYALQANGQSLKVIDIRKVNKSNSPRIVAEVDLGDKGLYGANMLLSLKPAGSSKLMDTAIIIGGESRRTRLIQVNIEKPQSPKVIADFTLDGQYTGVRLVNNEVRLVVNSQPLGFNWDFPSGSGLRASQDALNANKQHIRESELNNWIPAYQNNLDTNPQPQSLVDCSQVLVPYVFAGLDTLSIMTFNASERLSADAWRTIGLAATGQQIYANADSVYVATTEITERGDNTATGDNAGEVISGETFPDNVDGDLKTTIHKFGFSAQTRTSSRPSYVASGEVVGTLLNQFAMDEYKGDLRVAVTIDDFEDDQQENHVKILRPKKGILEEIGAVTGLGINERIFAVRFMGDRAYMVTFKQIDPLYALDLSEPTKPRALGELKIPGFSSYLHPVGDNLLLGIGQEADAEGQVEGLQLSLFDTADPTKPLRISQLLLKDALKAAGFEAQYLWGSSEAEGDHRAFLFYDEIAYIPYWASLNIVRPEGSGYAGEFLPRGILAVQIKDRALVSKTNYMLAVSNAKTSPTDVTQYRAFRRTIVVGDLVYGLGWSDGLAVWQMSTGKPLHYLP